tara:strand:- start:6831 stop:7538 length:708 start_codon:yes stop_codon:yes gene_type:complete
MSNSPYCINHDKKIVLIWSPKCACTSLFDGFVRNICNINTKNIICTRRYAIQKGFTKSDYDNIPKDYTIYFGVRDPFERIVSSYFNKFILYNNRRLTGDQLKFPAPHTLQQMKIDYNTLTFNKLLDGMVVLNKKSCLDSHFKHQINKSNFKKIKYHPKLIIFDINNIPEIFQTGNKRNITTKPQNPVYKDLCDELTCKIDRKELVHSNFESARKKVYEFYKSDYEILNKHGLYCN